MLISAFLIAGSLAFGSPGVPVDWVDQYGRLHEGPPPRVDGYDRQREDWRRGERGERDEWRRDERREEAWREERHRREWRCRRFGDCY